MIDYVDQFHEIYQHNYQNLTSYRNLTHKSKGIGGFDTNWDGHHDGGVVGRGRQFPLSANALSGCRVGVFE